MDKQQAGKGISLALPADMEYVLVARMALSGFGMVAGLDVDMIDDLRTITDEVCDCMLHQAVKLTEFHLAATVQEGRLCCRFCGVRGEERTHEAAQDKEITRGILETLLPDVEIHCDDDGVCCIEFSMPV